MECPKCGGQLKAVEFRDVEVDRCVVCSGIWFDFAEVEDLRDMVSSELVDTGSLSVGEEMDKITRIKCPVCSRKMIHLTDPEQHHLTYEVCPKCYGTYFDAGEFTDLKEFTPIERLKQLLQQML